MVSDYVSAGLLDDLIDRLFKLNIVTEIPLWDRNCFETDFWVVFSVRREKASETEPFDDGNGALSFDDENECPSQWPHSSLTGEFIEYHYCPIV